MPENVYSLKGDFATLKRTQMLNKEDVYSLESDFVLLNKTQMLKKKMHTLLKVILQH